MDSKDYAGMMVKELLRTTFAEWVPSGAILREGSHREALCGLGGSSGTKT